MLTSDQIFNGKNLKVLTLPVGQMVENCYLVYDKKSFDTMIIDPGDDPEYIENIIRDFNLNPINIVCTHGHSDHTGAVLELELAYNIGLAINHNDGFLLPPLAFVSLSDTTTVDLGNSHFKVIETPGHTPGSVCLFCESEKIMFVGDLIFSDGRVGRTDFKYSDDKELQKSIAKIKKLSSNIKVFPGHGEIFYL